MKRHFHRAITIAFITFLLGSGIDYLTNLESTLGLDTLFQLRGVRPPPPEVVVVAMDETSETRLCMGQDLTRWRSFHAKLIQELHRQGAALVIFDLQFIAPHPDNDPAFAAAMQAAGNVLVTDCVQKLLRGVEDFYGRDECSESNQEPFVQKEGIQKQPLSDQLIVFRLIKSPLAQSALDHAPFYLTNDAENPTVREGWTFLNSLAEVPTLSVVTWLYYLQRSNALQGITQPNVLFSSWLTEQRRQCASDLYETKNSPAKSGLENRIGQLTCLGDSRYLDFYGPPQTLRMESYSNVYEGKVVDLKGKVVFVGKANRKFSPGKTDYFQTPFTDTHSGKMAGVEIMATQFANLLEGRFIESPFPPSLLLVMFGLLIGLLLAQFAGLSGIAATLMVSGVYVGLAVWSFNRSGLCLPIAVPLLIQLPVSWFISLLWSRRDLLNERKRILAFVRRVFPQWMPLPSSPGQWYPEKGVAQLTSERDVFGLCLATDIEGYTTVAAQHTPHEMWELLNAYYQVLGYPVSSHNGIIADVTGDAMMAVWINLPVSSQRLAACLAALEMELAVERFNEKSNIGRLPTRIGLHEGDMTLGSLDAGEGSHYRAIGDTVNTASRIQGVNKFLDTQILATATIAASLGNVIYRPVGIFRLVGRDEPLELIEIVGMEADASVSKHAIYKQFARGLSAFQEGRWEDAAADFQMSLDSHGYDGPTRFYLDLAVAYKKNEPLEWDGIVAFGQK
ncbi:adenylate/guanylate cyclase domain-containing protein [Methyloglobulus sp.]|uniref:adenylate/guanylate cyclase domain-containing protein n=1 Tax=Methyloglobulus sp. TaxID=2518622 RepID=UPI0032B7241F